VSHFFLDFMEGIILLKKERIEKTLAGEPVDHVAMLGGFLVSSDHYLPLSVTDRQTFYSDREKWAARAYGSLGVDGLILLRLPSGKDGHEDYRPLNRDEFDAAERRFKTCEDVLLYAQSLPSPEKVLEDFDAQKWKAEFIQEYERTQKILGDMLWLPTQWDIVHPTFEFYNIFGYQNYMEFLGLYPDSASKLFGTNVLVMRRISEMIVEIYEQFGVPKLVHLGTDICGKNGPVAGPTQLKQYYLPHVEKSIEPLVEGGFATVWHSDGDFMPIIDDLIEIGISGFQGFQWEYGLKLEDIVKRRTRDGELLTIFAGPSVTSTLPEGGIEDVKREVEYIIDTASGNCKLFILPANDVLPDVPLDNLVTFHEHAIEYSSKN
jgi:hypothetical protein